MVAFINKMDKLGADFAHAVDTIRDRLDSNPVAVQWPIGCELDFRGFVDLLEMRATVWSDETGVAPEAAEIPPELMGAVIEAREQAVERIVETDDGLLSLYVDGQEISAEQLRQALRRATVSGELAGKAACSTERTANGWSTSPVAIKIRKPTRRTFQRDGIASRSIGPPCETER